MRNLASTGFGLVALASLIPAQDVPAEPARPQERSLDYQTGKVTVKGGVATIDLPDGWRYLQQQDARHVVEQVWGNPQDPETLGLIVPPADDRWAVIVSYDSSGHVKDDDAASTDFGELLAGMQEDTRASNAERRRQGYPAVELRGWAEPPHWDGAQKKLYWAKRLQFEGSAGETLNWDVRLLGADGCLVMSAVAGIEDLPAVASGAKEVLQRTELAAGHRYSDFDPSLHEVAAYGIGGLIAGKLLVKAGLLKVLLKPLLIAGAVGIAVLAKVLGRKRKGAAETLPG